MIEMNDDARQLHNPLDQTEKALKIKSLHGKERQKKARVEDHEGGRPGYCVEAQTEVEARLTQNSP